MADNLDKLVQNYLTKNLKTDSRIQNAISVDINSEVEKLKESILKFVTSDTIKNSIIVKDGKTPMEKIITFDESAFVNSAFKEEPFNYSGYSPDFYKPMAFNEGYTLKNEKWKKYFGRGAKREADLFIEKGISDYQSKNRGKLNIKVEKTGTFKYKNYTSSINEEIYYGDNYLDSTYTLSFY